MGWYLEMGYICECGVNCMSYTCTLLIQITTFTKAPLHSSGRSQNSQSELTPASPRCLLPLRDIPPSSQSQQPLPAPHPEAGHVGVGPLAPTSSSHLSSSSKEKEKKKKKRKRSAGACSNDGSTVSSYVAHVQPSAPVRLPSAPHPEPEFGEF